MVLPGSSIEAAYVRAERIRCAFAANGRFIGGRRVEATVSCGLSVSVSGEQTLTELLEAADWALYDAKAAGRNRVKRSGESKAGDRSVRGDPRRLKAQRHDALQSNRIRPQVRTRNACSAAILRRPGRGFYFD